jgi:hypothetical protein
LLSINWCNRHDFPDPALPITKNLNKKSENIKHNTYVAYDKEISFTWRRIYCTENVPYDSDIVEFLVYLKGLY